MKSNCCCYRLPFFIAVLLLVVAPPVFSADPQQDYFYLREAQHGPYRNSCVQIFNDLRAGKTADVGGIIRQLKFISVDYRLRDYDNALSRNKRKSYVDYDALLKEVETGKQEIYCKIELAEYMRGRPEFSGPIFDELLATAFDKLAETYTEASQSLNSGDFERALYAFDLIAPYADSYQLFLLAGDKQLEESRALALQQVETDAVAASEDAVVAEGVAPGPIMQAVQSADLPAGSVLGNVELAQRGAISLATQVGAITAAVASGGD